MSYTQCISLSMGSSKAGLTLAAQLVDRSGVDQSSPVTTGFAEVGQGNYLWLYEDFPDGFRGGVKFYNTLDPSVILAFTSINPEEVESIDNITTILNSPRTIEITNPQSGSGTTEVYVGHSSSKKVIDIKTGVR